MIEPHAPAPPGAPSPWRGSARLPVRPDVGRFLVLACVFVCAACGLVYELELVALASYLMGDSVTQASVVLSVMVFAMGIGSLAAKRFRRFAAAGFGALEAVLALVGGCSAMVLYAVFAWTGDWGGLWADGPRILLVVFSLAIGLLIGAEVPSSWSSSSASAARKRAAPSPTCSPRTTSAGSSAASPSPSCCCRSAASSPAPC